MNTLQPRETRLGASQTRKISATLQHRRSAKLLINKYESMNSDGKTEKSPLGKSLRNMLSVFKKSARNDDYDHPPRQLVKLDTPMEDPFACAAPVIPAKSNATISGTLLYLSRQSTSPEAGIRPVWIECKAALDVDRLVLTWNTSFGNPCTHYIPLFHLTDVRSLAWRDLGSDERRLLPQIKDTDESKSHCSFEILFEGKAREKFAASSVQARASWVSGIWDAVLPAQERSLLIETTSAAASEKENVGPIALPLPLALVDRALPSLPSSPKETQLFPQPVMITPLTPPPSLRTFKVPISRPHAPQTASTLPSQQSERNPMQPRSPSISNLGQLSVVKQRLAQIERTNSHSSSISSHHSSSASRKHYSSSASTAIPLTPSRYAKSEADSEADSILDEYMDNVLFPPPATEVSGSDEGYYSTKSVSPDSQLIPVQVTGLPYEMPNPPARMSPCPSESQYTTTVTVEQDMTPDISPLVELLQDHAARGYDQAANLSVQIVALQHDIHNIPRDISAAAAETSNKTVPVLNSVQNTINRLEERAQSNVNGTKEVSLKLDSLKTQIQQDAADDAKTGLEVTRALNGIQQRLGGDLPEILKRLAQLKETMSKERSAPVVTMSNVAMDAKTESAVIPDAEMHTKLDNLSRLLEERPVTGASNEQLSSELKTVVALLKSEENQRSLQSQQQADSVRYLNELNSWLEAFVNNGTSQIQTLSVGVEQLCRELGTNMDGPESSSLLRDVRQLLYEARTRDQSAVALQSSVNQLLGVMSNETQRNSLTPESVVELIEHQRQHQEGLLKTLTSQLSSEIRGERLRFVEAMKEATAINVQAHVEQFKIGLGHEVANMTREVGHLQRERQMVENQIAELATYHQKQKESVNAGHPSGHPVTVTVTHSPQQQQHLYGGHPGAGFAPPRLQYARV